LAFAGTPIPQVRMFAKRVDDPQLITSLLKVGC